ncbi:dihydrolipoamide acetyltransferase family protein [Nocardia abscessus]|uniref:dihydrolipoamide acetyltransferase family protein n=1 Tax=Nocardia abscessus TaxID=120957 RepID=UPI00245701A5|nr:dihydrolipoamide acetyltransferase family protein [Nocardia abscessus]
MMTENDAIHEVMMPRLSDTMTEGTIAKWLKAEGDAVAAGDLLAEIDTDKVTAELEAPVEGTVLRLLVAEGSVVAPGEVMALLGPEGAEVPELEKQSRARPISAAEAGSSPAIRSSYVAADVAARGVRASPLAKRVAARNSLDLASLGRGSGPNGRILRADVERAVAARPTVPHHLQDEVIVPGRLQLAMARRLTAAKQEIPHFYLDVSADVTRLCALREDARAQQSPLDVPVSAYVLRAVALALRQFPRVNASWTADGILLRSSVNVGFAVALDEEGLVVPVVHDADAKRVAELAAESAELVAKARDGKLTAADMSGGSFTISNLGMLGVETFHAVINPPESGILAVGGIRRVPSFEGEQVVARDVIGLSLSVDHRVFSGATAAAFLADVRSRLERPLGLV